MLRWSRRRVFSFLGVAAPLLLLETTSRALWPALLVAAAGAAIFFAFSVARHRQCRRTRDSAKLSETLALEGMARRRRDWRALPLPSLEPASARHPWSGDLDLFGEGSLSHLLGTPRTAPGLYALREALLDPLSLGQTGRELRRAQVEALSRMPERLEAVQRAARTVRAPEGTRQLEAFLAWAEGPRWRANPLRWRVGAIALGATNLTLVVLSLGFGAPPFWILGVGAAFWLSSRIRPEAHPRFDAVEGAEGSLGRWSALLEATAALPAEDEALAVLRAAVGAEVGGAEQAAAPKALQAPAHEALHALARMSDWAAIRHSSLVYVPLVALLAWDVHPLLRLEQWRERHGAHARRWLTAVGELELVVALATLRFDHPDWSLPSEVVSEAASTQDSSGNAPKAAASTSQSAAIQATAIQSTAIQSAAIQALGLRHPLLDPARAVPNDVSVPSGGSLLLVTGSNMSGKSTLLRAIGLNQLLMLMGGPVAADAFHAPPIGMWTSMRIRDSLKEGVSHFMAELERLRAVVEGARGAPSLVLLDEILQGTNSAERATAGRIILHHLLAAKAVGAVSTHDLTLSDDPGLHENLVQVHLRETVETTDSGARTLWFDHRLRPGPATSRNALLLMEGLGLTPLPK
jgi:hypothetical protein